MTAVIILVAIAVVLIVFIIALYNKLVKLRNMVDNAWAQIDVQRERYAGRRDAGSCGCGERKHSRRTHGG